MGKIVLLDDLTINQIAAGEVIERPASVVKELIENSIDAGATKIDIEVQNGGIKKIRIIDNGSGIQEDDMEFAFERHATSKIRKAQDLESVKSMGFRGEALASIASIAHVELVSKTKEDTVGHKIVIEGETVLEKSEVGCQTGTTITVTNLFYNTPVRYKFLKKDYTELGYIEDVVTRVALANPNVAIKLKNENKQILQTTGNGDLKSIIYSLYGKETSEHLIDVDYTYDDITVKGVVGKPEIARGNKSFQMFFINKRYIKDKTLSASAEQAFKGLLPIGKFGFLIIEIEMDPKKIDVNVHPTKLEVRFQEEQKVFKAVYHAIRDSLLKTELVREDNYNYEQIELAKQDVLTQSNATSTKQETISENSMVVTKQEILPQSNNVAIKNIETKKEELIVEPKTQTGLFSLFKKREENEDVIEQSENVLAEIFSKKNKENNTNDQSAEEYNKSVIEDKGENVSKSEEEKQDFNEMYNKTFGKEVVEEKIKSQVSTFENMSVFEDVEKYEIIPQYKYCGTVFSTYLIIEMNNEMYMIDQHAAHERIMYEKVKKNYYRGENNNSQILLLPDIVNLSHKEKAVVKENIGMFEKAGFIIEEFGDSTVRLIGVPASISELDTKEIFLEILDTINTVAITALQEKEDKFLATIACKAAVKAGKVLDLTEIKELLDELLKLPNPFTCPHGRPTTIKMSKYDIERRFNRK